MFVQVGAGLFALVARRTPWHGLHLVLGSAATLLPFAAYLAARRRRHVSLYLAAACLIAFLVGSAALLLAG